MSWKDQYKKALITVVARRGSLVDPKANLFGWTHLDWLETRKRIDKVGIDFVKTPLPVESSWDEFGGTFTDHDNTKYGVDVHLVLNDGSTHHIRYSYGMSKLIKEILEVD